MSNETLLETNVRDKIAFPVRSTLQRYLATIIEKVR